MPNQIESRPRPTSSARNGNSVNGFRDAKTYVPFDLKTAPWNWGNIAYLTILHGMGIVAIVWMVQHFGQPGTLLGISWPVLIWTILFGVFTSLGVTVGYHRYATHASFVAGNEWVEGILLFAGGTAVEGSLSRWRYVHLVHHAFTDTPGKDPHTPKQFKNPVIGFAWSHMLWFLWDTELIKIKDIPETRLVSLQRRYYWVNVLATLVIPWALCGFTFEGLLIGGFLRVMFLLHATACINSVAHFWGDQLEYYRKLASFTDKTARNVYIWLPLWILSAGESWHFNHHAIPKCAAHGWTKYQFDFSKKVIQWMEKHGWAEEVAWMHEQRAKVLASQPTINSG